MKNLQKPEDFWSVVTMIEPGKFLSLYNPNRANRLKITNVKTWSFL